MHALVKTSLIVTSIALSMPLPASAKKVAASPLWSGTWQLNVAASKLTPPVGKRSETRIYVVTGNEISVKATGTDATGKALQYSYAGPFDGKPYPMIGNPVGDKIALTLVNPLRADATVTMGKTVTAMSSSNISPDGKHLTLKRRTLRAKAAPAMELLEFDKK